MQQPLVRLNIAKRRGSRYAAAAAATARCTGPGTSPANLRGWLYLPSAVHCAGLLGSLEALPVDDAGARLVVLDRKSVV